MRARLPVPPAALLVAALLVAARLVPAPLAPARPAAGWGARYAVDCPERCDRAACASRPRCEPTVLDDCACCRVCAARRGETCYRTVSGMDGVKCGPGLRCQFYSEEDDFGDEFGVCRDCPFGTFGVDCRETCSCQLGICDRVTGKCLKFPFFQYAVTKSSNNRFGSHTEQDEASGDGNAVTADLGQATPARTPLHARHPPRRRPR